MTHDLTQPGELDALIARALAPPLCTARAILAARIGPLPEPLPPDLVTAVDMLDAQLARMKGQADG